MWRIFYNVKCRLHIIQLVVSYSTSDVVLYFPLCARVLHIKIPKRQDFVVCIEFVQMAQSLISCPIHSVYVRNKNERQQRSGFQFDHTREPRHQLCNAPPRFFFSE